MSAPRENPLSRDVHPQEEEPSDEEKRHGASYEDELPFLRKEDEFHRTFAPKSHRIRSSNTSSSFASYSSDRSSELARGGGLSHETERTPSFRSNHMSNSAPLVVELSSQKPLDSSATSSHPTPDYVRRVISNMSLDSTSSTKDERKRKEKDRAKERFQKLESLNSGFERGRIADFNDQGDVSNKDDDDEIDDFETSDTEVFSSGPAQIVSMTPDDFLATHSYSTLTLKSSYHSDAVSGVLDNLALGESSSLPRILTNRGKVDNRYLKLSKINLRLDQCEALRFPRKKELFLDKLNIRSSDIPMQDLCGTSLGNSLYKLSLSGNCLQSIPPKLVMCLPSLRVLDLSQCELHQLPEQFNLPKLARLILSNNRLTEFPEENMLEGLPELQELYMYGNQVSVIVVPTNPKILCKLEILDLGYNNLPWLPDDLDRLKSLRTFKVMNNFLSKVPMRICDMNLKVIDVSSNPVTEPPYETCARGIRAMRRYWYSVRQSRT